MATEKRRGRYRTPAIRPPPSTPLPADTRAWTGAFSRVSSLTSLGGDALKELDVHLWRADLSQLPRDFTKSGMASPPGFEPCWNSIRQAISGRLTLSRNLNGKAAGGSNGESGTCHQRLILPLRPSRFQRGVCVPPGAESAIDISPNQPPCAHASSCREQSWTRP